MREDGQTPGWGGGAPIRHSSTVCAHKNPSRIWSQSPERTKKLQCCGSGSVWIQQKVKEQLNKTVNSGLFVLYDCNMK